MTSPSPSEDLVALLQAMKEEHERNTAMIETLEQQRRERARGLADTFEQIQAVENEVAQIVEKTQQSAGSARQLSEVLEAEQAEANALLVESTRIDSELETSTASFEAMQVQSAESSIEAFQSLEQLRCTWRKRNRDGYSSLIAQLCVLSALESEAERGAPIAKAARHRVGFGGPLASVEGGVQAAAAAAAACVPSIG